MTAGKFRYILAALTVLLVMTALCIPGVSAVQGAQAHAIPSAEAEALFGEFLLNDFTKNWGSTWMVGTGTVSLERQTLSGEQYLSASSGGPSADGMYSVMCLYGEEGAPNLMNQSELRFSIYISGDAGDMHAVRLTLYSGESSMEAYAPVGAGEWYTFTADIGDWPLRTYINMCEVTVLDGGSGVQYFTLGKFTAGGVANLDVAQTFLTFGYQAEGGAARYEDGVYILSPESSGTMTLLADAARGDYMDADGITALRVVLDNAREGGVISLAVSEGFSYGSSFEISSTCPIYYGENTYILPYDSDISLHAYRLSFHGLYSDMPGGVILRSVSMVTFPEAEEIEYAARLSECSFDEGMKTLRVSGTLPAGITAEYIDAELALFEYPMWENEALIFAQGEPVMTLPMSTRFTFTMDLSGREHTASASRYQLAILTQAGRIPLSAPVYPEHYAVTAKRTQSVIGLYGADSAAVFDSNASSVILDVYADRLMGGAAGNTGGRLTVRGGQHYYLENAYIRELDAEINFCISAGTEVYLRLVCAEDLSAKGYTRTWAGAKFYAFDVHNAAGASMLSAVTDFLAARYSDVCGFVVGARLDAADYNGASMADMDSYAALCADTMRLIYNCAVTHIPDVCVVAPIGHNEEESRADGAYADPVLLSSMISRYIYRDGEMPWVLLYISDLAAEALGHTQNILTQMKTVGCALPRDTMLLWQPPANYSAEIISAEYEERAYAASRAGVRVLFLSASSLAAQDQRNVAAALKYTLDTTEYRRPLSEYEAEVLAERPLYSGWYALGDFSRSYSTLGWIAGSGCSRLLSRSSESITGRSLHAAFEPADGSLFTPVSGNILCVSGVTDNLTYAPYVIYSLQATTQLESAETAELVFIFGSGDVRAEYTVTVPTGVPVEILCDLSQFSGADRVDFSAISVQCDSAVALDIRQIRCCSNEYDGNALAQLYRYRSVSASRSEDSSSVSFTAAQKTFVGMLILSSVVVVALFSRRRGGRA